MAKEKPLTATDIGDLADEIAHEAHRFRARLALADRLVALKALLSQEATIRGRVEDLQRQAAALADREEELANLDTELARRKKAAEAEAESILRRARADGDSVVANARATGEIIVAKAKEAAEQMTAQAAAAVQRRENDLAILDTAIAQRQADLDRINQHISELRRKIGVQRQERPMPTPAGAHDNKVVNSNEVRDGRTYDRSVKIGDAGGASETNPHPSMPFQNPDPKSIHTFDISGR
jgi:DNA repair exonuclease SbcCD ATPase subunit